MTLTDKDIDEGMAHLDHQFMQPQVWRETGRLCDWFGDGNICELPESYATADPAGEIAATLGRRTKGGWWAMLSAPGYLDRTDPAGPFKTERDAEAHLVETYADDIDDCPDCAGNEE